MSQWTGGKGYRGEAGAPARHLPPLCSPKQNTATACHLLGSSHVAQTVLQRPDGDLGPSPEPAWGGHRGSLLEQVTWRGL